MSILRIHDLRGHALGVRLRDLLALLAPGSLEATWVVSGVEATGGAAETLETLADGNVKIEGTDLAALVDDVDQVIWGFFTARAPVGGNDVWLTIRAIDSTFLEVVTSDTDVIGRIKSSCKDVRVAEHPWRDRYSEGG